MANGDMIARLADLREFAELRAYYNEIREEEVQRLARKTFALPESHDRIEWERLKARWDAIDALLELPAKERDKRKESD